MKKLSSRQLYFFLACIAPLGKIIVLPSQLVYYAQNDLLLSAALNFALQAGAVFLALLCAKRNQTLYDLLKQSLGKVVASICVCLFSAFLFYAALLPLLEHRLFVQSVFYDTLPSLLAFAPFFLFIAYVCFQPLSSFGRICDILAPVAIVCFVGLMVLSVGEADFGALLPLGASGAKGIFGGTAFTMNWFYDSALLLLMMGRFDYQKGMAWKGALCYALGGVAVLLLLAVFYGVFSVISLRQLFAFAEISQFFSGVDVLGRIDYLFIYTLAIPMAFYCVLPLQAGAQGLKDVLGEKKALSATIAVTLSLAMLILSVTLVYSFQPALDFISKRLFWIFPLFCLLIPAILLLLRRRRETV